MLPPGALVVLVVGIEPTREIPQDFKSRLSAYSITPAYMAGQTGLEPAHPFGLLVV